MGFFKFYKEEVEVIKDRDPAIKKDIEAILYPSFWAIYNYRKAHKARLQESSGTYIYLRIRQ